jgi:hypothetical protein
MKRLVVPLVLLVSLLLTACESASGAKDRSEDPRAATGWRGTHSYEKGP